MDPPPIPLIRINNDDKSYKDFVKIELCRDTTSENLDFYEFKMALFGNGDSEEFLLFICNFNMTITASGRLEAGAKIR